MSEPLVPGPGSGNLPQPSAAFVGRQRELEAIVKRLSEPGCRLLTLVGPGGIGKTRLALEAATVVEEQVRDGAWLVELDALSDPVLVPRAVAAALGLRDLPDRALVAGLSAHLRSKQALLLLDNCEHLLEACASLAETLLSTCPHLLMLATSREPLHVAGEVSWLVGPLGLPALDPLPAPGDLLECEAIELFVERAQRAFPDFSLTSQNAPDVVQICTRLDGLPLAIELAAVWVRVLSVGQIGQRLDDRFRLLVRSWPTPARHQTLEAALDWSYDLLSYEERILFLRLSVFAGSFGLEAAEAVCAGAGLEEVRILELLSHLVDKSLVVVVRERGQPRRYRLLDTVRQYARQHSQSSGELTRLGDRHLQWYLGLAEELEPHLWGAADLTTLHRLEQEEDNLRAALRWSISEVRIEEGLRLAAAFGWYWYVRAHLLEGRSWLEQVLGLGPGGSTLARARALNVAGALTLLQEDSGPAVAFLEEGLELVRERAQAGEEGWLLSSVGFLDLLEGRYSRAEQRFDRCRALFEEAQDEAGTATVLLYQGILACYRANYSLAELRLEQSFVLLKQLGDAVAMARALHGLGMVARHATDLDRAQALYREALQLAWERGARLEVAQAIEGLAGVASDQGLPLRAAHLWGAAAALRELIGVGLPKGSSAGHNRDLDCVRTQLGASTFETAWDSGRRMSPDRLREYAASDDEGVASAMEADGAEVPATKLTPLQAEKLLYEGLTRRERQVAALVALGMSNKEIAAELVVTVRTVEAHVTSTLSKLGFSSRTQIATWAVDKGLASPPRTLTERMRED